ncbi:MAG: bifunctional phosphoribosylaminoimidazolecarboxamide formyltransferase/IMP cyclohydrolase PurH [Bacteroidetes bacterium]|nr:MAG: bifunctional phosphoribosylaminoimidazolecarboxamide formyltransferase/IMP cyclohydrolase PurH [Bacteroidota bacterium]REK04958.1 MAG: bifunctional phosphoribosylaminoimidazolecarboxamide formyltransferase/IMP cyclohydrolase PurH [Bacteroidota bacterium]REK50904.1 MAG: bifunctional phosphoribosylaminoimidazolecarboxamide formyltransferase/IMP cyclohydrolase PurH [Bacteroidota bacterium]
MGGRKKVSSALVSVYHKDRLDGIARRLHELGITIFATGGTQDFIEGIGIPVTPVENLTDYPSILGGRVKTLHPKIFGGILSRRENPSDVTELLEFKIPEIDLVIVDLYPFEATLASGASDAEVIEKIDIGGISLIRAAAKNFKDVLIIPSVSQYAFLETVLFENDAYTSLEERKRMAAHAFSISSSYDSAIFNYFNEEVALNVFNVGYKDGTQLRYGENPHQKGFFYGKLSECLSQIHGKELSYNNILDVDAAINLISDFKEPCISILKHNNACGVASGDSLLENWNKALAADPVSAFGGVVISNQELTIELAAELNKIFFEICIAPSYTDEALGILKQKKNRIILKLLSTSFGQRQFRTALNGVLAQDKDLMIDSEENLKTVTKSSPSIVEMKDLLFAMKIAKHTKSNTIVLAKDSCMLASGTGQTSRVDALNQAIEKAKKFGFDLKGAVMASDAFFPFPDCVEIAHSAGIRAVIQPGGSVKDQESVDYCDRNGMTMVMTGIRHFRH